MLLVRMAGLIALPLVATTLQTSARSVPVPADQPPTVPARQEAPVPNKLTQQPEKRELIIVLAPHTSVLRSQAPEDLLDGPGPHPADLPVQTVFRPVGLGRDAGRFLDTEAFLPPVQSTHPWMAARYPHAPPARS